MRDFSRLLVPYDFSEHSAAALDVAIDLGRRLGAELHLLHVVIPPVLVHPTIVAGGVPPVAALPDLREHAARSLAEVAAKHADAPVEIEVHVADSGGAVADRIQQVAERIGADLIVMGTHGRSGLARVFVGSVTEQTLRRAGRPVLTIPLPLEDDPGDEA